MRPIAVIIVVGALSVAIPSRAHSQDPEKKGSVKGAAKSPDKAQATQSKPVSTETAPVAATMSADEVAVRKTGDSYIEAFNRGDAKATAEHYTADAEYIDETGHLLQGRPAIEESMKAFYAKNPGSKLALTIESIRMIGPGIAIEDGLTTVTNAGNIEPVIARYTATHVKSAGKWLTASVRDSAVKLNKPHRFKLQQLDWLLGEWVHEGNDAVVVFNCHAIDEGNFLDRNFTVKIGGQVAMKGTQRIGWDALANKFRTWIFDSDGGHSEGYWHRDGDNWVLKSSGVTADGQPASSTSIYTFVNPHTMTFQSLDHEVAGVELPDGPKITIVRHPPRPE